jgi:hypothetical protein
VKINHLRNLVFGHTHWFSPAKGRNLNDPVIVIHSIPLKNPAHTPQKSKKTSAVSCGGFQSAYINSLQANPLHRIIPSEQA